MLEVNGRRYALPRQPTVVVCVDGCEPDYIAQAVADGHMPWLKRVLAEGTALIADCVVPSFTNPNNLSIVTGAPPSVHGICGNYLFDVDSGTEVMMNDPKWLRAPTHPGRAGRRRSVAAPSSPPRTSCASCSATACKGICFSAEKADEASAGRKRHRATCSSWSAMPLPDVYSAALSEFVFAAGVQLMRKHRPDVMYLSTTDYVQHKHAPGTAERRTRSTR